MKLSLTFSQRVVLLFLLFIVGALLSGGMQMLTSHLTDNQLAASRIAMVMQDLLAFILPAIITALMVTRLPADFLRLRSLPRGAMMAVAALTLLAAIPLIEWVNALCEALPWPSQVIALEQQLAATTEALIGPRTGGNLAVSILIMSVLTALAEELFFRGALQELLASRPMSAHAAVWITALIFALMHAQPVGVLPRILLGAFFGYAVIWSGSLWTAVALHAINNAAAVITLWAGINISQSIPAPMVVLSAAVTAAGLFILVRQSRSRSSGI